MENNHKKHTAKANPMTAKYSFSEEQITTELNLQGLNSIKGSQGAYLLYRHIKTNYEKIEKKILSRVFKDCGFIDKIKITEISIGEFYLKKTIPLEYFLTGDFCYEIVPNPTLAFKK